MGLVSDWVACSRHLAISRGYLDLLQGVYPLIPTVRDGLSEEAWHQIERALIERDGTRLIELLLDTGRAFPVEDSYVPFLRSHRAAVAANPEVAARIADRIFELSGVEIKALLNGPPKLSRQLGPAFSRWIRDEFRRNEWPVLPPNDFRASQGISLLDATDAGLLEFSQRELGMTHEKRPDMIARVGDYLLVGEAKLISDDGGSQRNQFRDAIGLLSATANPDVLRAAIVDGYVWLAGPNHEFTRAFAEHADDEQAVALSALLLPELIRRLAV